LQQSGTSRFWGNFNSDLLVKNVSDQGPFGGRRAIFARKINPKSFSAIFTTFNFEEQQIAWKEKNFPRKLLLIAAP
jgi:hypothetical protein